MGRTSYGVRGIKLIGEDRVVGSVVVSDANATLITGCEAGYGKRTPLEEYPIKGRGGQGVINIKTEGRNGPVVGIALAKDGDDVMFITQMGMIVRTSIVDISTMGRNTQGVRLVNLKDGDKLVALEVVSEQDLERFATEAAQTPVRTGQRPELITEDGDEADGEEEEIDDVREEEPES
jgi:DNA gyrase subunit A